MRRTALSALVLACVATPALAQSPFDGTWKLVTDDAQVSSGRFDISLDYGVYACRSCTPSWSVPADGRFHPVTGHGDFDETSVQVMDNRTVIFTRRKGGRGVYQAVDSISEDGNFLAFSWTEFGGAGTAVSGTGSWIRVTPRRPGSHPITGTWRELRPDSMSDNASTFTIRTHGDALHMTFGTGESLTARFGGPPAKFDGDPSGTLVSVRRINDKAFEETDMRDGQIVTVRTSTLLDASTMQIMSRNERSGRETRRRARRR